MLIDITPELQEKMSKRLKAMAPEIFALKVLKAVAKNKAYIIVPSWWKIFWWLCRFSPSLGLFMARKSFMYGRKELEQHH